MAVKFNYLSFEADETMDKHTVKAHPDVIKHLLDELCPPDRPKFNAVTWPKPVEKK